MQFIGMRTASVKQYMMVIGRFVAWCLLWGLFPELPFEYDDLLVEYQASSPQVTKSEFNTLIAAIERLLPIMRGELVTARAVAASWTVAFEARHAVPLELVWGTLIAYHLCEIGLPTVAALLVIQCGIGLRPSEALRLRASDLILPWEMRRSAGAGVVLVGSQGGTKANRAQPVRVERPIVLAAMMLLKAWALARSQGHLHGIRSLGGLHWRLKRGASLAGLASVGWTPHSPRSGFVTEPWLLGAQLATIAATTRHQSLKSLKSYLDVAAVRSGQLSLELRPHLSRAKWAEDNIVRALQTRLAPEVTVPVDWMQEGEFRRGVN